MTSSTVFSTSPNEVRVLLVDDHEDMLSMMQVLMTQRDYAVQTAQSAQEALQLAPGFAPHIVVSDIGMPGMDGYEMMTRLRAEFQGPHFKAIALTGFDAGDDGRLQEAGFDAHLLKPVDFDALFDLIEQLTPTQ